MNVEVSQKYILVKHPTRGITPYQNHCDLDLFAKAKSRLSFDCQYAFQSEGGGFALDGNPHADAMAAFSL